MGSGLTKDNNRQTIADNTIERESRTANSSYKKWAVLWFNEALRFVSSSVVTDSFRLRNRQLLEAARR